jgi:hypothetical protein
MIKNSHKEIGSAHVAIVVILVILLIGALGFIFWQNYTAKNAQQPSTAQTVTDNEDTSSQSERYAVLEDWDVKFKLDDHLKGAAIVQYKQKEQGQDGREYYLLNTDRGEKAAQKACPSLSDPTGLGLYRSIDKPSANAEGQLLEANGKLLNNTAINGHYYVLVSLGWMCPSVDGASQSANEHVDTQSDNEALLASLLTLQPAR